MSQRNQSCCYKKGMPKRCVRAIAYHFIWFMCGAELPLLPCQLRSLLLDFDIMVTAIGCVLVSHLH